MDLKRLGQQAKSLIDKRGGTESVKEDAEELRGIAKGSGSLTDKAKAAVGAIKDPGADDHAPAAAAPAAQASDAEVERADEKVEGEARGKHAGHKGHGGHGRGRHREGGDGGGADPAV